MIKERDAGQATGAKDSVPQLSQLLPGSSMITGSDVRQPTPAGEPSGAKSTTGVETISPGSAKARSSGPSNAPASLRARRTMFAAVGLGGLLIVGGALVTRARSHDGDGSGVPPTVSAGASATAGANDTKLSAITLRASPREAKLYFDDILLPENPVTRSFPLDGATHRVRAEALGFDTRQDFVVLNARAIVVQFQLEKSAPPVAPTARATASPPPVGGGGAAKPKPRAVDPGTTPPPAGSAAKPKATLDQSDPWKNWNSSPRAREAAECPRPSGERVFSSPRMDELEALRAENARLLDGRPTSSARAVKEEEEELRANRALFAARRSRASRSTSGRATARATVSARTPRRAPTGATSSSSGQRTWTSRPTSSRGGCRTTGALSPGRPSVATSITS